MSDNMYDRIPYLILFVLTFALCIIEYRAHEETRAKLIALQQKQALLEHVAGVCNDQLVQSQAYQARVAWELSQYSQSCHRWIKNQTVGE